jgi:MFS family permease
VTSIERTTALRIWIATAFVSNIGAWMQATAIPWIVLTRPDGAGVLDAGAAMAAQFAPQVLVPYLVARFADRVGRQGVLTVTQSGLALAAASLALLVAVEAPLWALLAALVAFGTVQAADGPVRQAMIGDLSRDGGMIRSVAWTSLAFHGARTLGPVAFAIVATIAAPVWAIAINAVTHVFVAIVALIIRRRTVPSDHESPRRPITIRDLLGNAWIRLTLATAASMSVISLNFSILGPALVGIGWNEPATSWATLSACHGIGALVGALVMTRFRSSGWLRVSPPAAVIGLTLCAIGLATNRTFAFACAILLGLATQALLATITASTQIATPPAARARAMALQGMALTGSVPIGAMLAAVITAATTPQTALILSGAATLIAAFALWIAEQKLHQPSPDTAG